jgi:hypothetical protein
MVIIGELIRKICVGIDFNDLSGVIFETNEDSNENWENDGFTSTGPVLHAECNPDTGVVLLSFLGIYFLENVLRFLEVFLFSHRTDLFFNKNDILQFLAIKILYTYNI